MEMFIHIVKVYTYLTKGNSRTYTEQFSLAGLLLFALRQQQAFITVMLVTFLYLSSQCRFLRN